MKLSKSPLQWTWLFCCLVLLPACRKDRFNKKLQIDLEFVATHETLRYYDIAHDDNNTLWVANYYGLGYLDGNEIQYITNDSLQANVLTFDKEDGLWFGTNTGLYRHNLISGTTEQVIDPFVNDNVFALYCDSEGAIWYGRSYYALFDDNLRHYFVGRIFQGNIEEVELLPTYNITEWNAVEQNVMALQEDETGAMWVGTSDEGLYRVRPDMTSQKYPLPDEADNIERRYIPAIEISPEGQVWFGTGRGLFKIEDGSPQLVTEDFKRCNGQLGCTMKHRISSLTFDENGYLWLTNRDEIALLNFDNGRIYSYEKILTEASARGSYHVIHADQNHQLWVGTTSGLARMEVR